MNILIIGGGNMGLAIAERIRQLLPAFRLSICERNPERYKFLQQKEFTLLRSQNYGGRKKIKLFNQISESVIKENKIIILAIKPQDITALLNDLLPFITNQLIISIAAGYRLSKIQKILKTKKIVRVMPNMPALIGQGISAWYAEKEVTKQDKKSVQQILKTFGEEIEVKNEKILDIVTAVSGSGPAYVFYFINSLIAGAVNLGLDKNMAKKITLQTVIGSSLLAKNSTDDLVLLQQKVTSKGGTTEQAIKVFAENKLSEIIKQGIEKARERAAELSAE